MLSVQALQSNLIHEFDFTRNRRLPSLFFIDIQKSQIDGLVAMIQQRIGEKAETTPTVRARISAVNGNAFDFAQREVRQQQGQIGREFAVTYRPNLDENETITAGSWWNPDSASDVPQVSVDEDMAERLNVGVGDSITFDISGRKITAQVANLRQIDLRNTRTAFVFVFRPGALEKAPQTYAATVLSRVPATERQRLQREIIGEFPNVQIFDVADIVAAVQKLVNNFVIAISFVGSFVILSGILILMGSVALTKSQRIYENAILKTLARAGRHLRQYCSRSTGCWNSFGIDRGRFCSSAFFCGKPIYPRYQVGICSFPDGRRGRCHDAAGDGRRSSGKLRRPFPQASRYSPLAIKQRVRFQRNRTPGFSLYRFSTYRPSSNG